MGRKGIYWHLLSIKVRRRDFAQYGGECIDQCGRRAKSWRELQGGHYLPASKCGFDLLFDERNVNGQMPVCNNPRMSNQTLVGIGYAKGLNKRYGAGTAEGLFARYQESEKGTPAKEWSQLEYDAKIRQLIDEIAAMDDAR